MTCAGPTPSACVFLGRRGGCGAGGHSVRHTGPEGPAPAAVSGGGEAGLCPAGAGADEGRA
jgi:hypothetical protein